MTTRTAAVSPARRLLPALGACGCIALAVLTAGCGRATVRCTLYGTPDRCAIADTAQFRKVVYSYIGATYKYGAMSRDGVDCSGLACLVYREYPGIRLPRSAVDQIKIGAPVPLRNATLGDLVFFRWRRGGGPDHVGIYIGDGRFVHASTKLGVIESTLADGSYRDHVIGVRRIVQ